MSPNHPEIEGQQSWSDAELSGETPEAKEPVTETADETNEVPRFETPKADTRLYEFINKPEVPTEKRTREIIKSYYADLGQILFEYNHTEDRQTEHLLEEQMDRIQVILCKIILDTQEKRHQALDLLGNKIIPDLRKDLLQEEEFERRHEDNEIPRGPEKKSGETELEIVGAETLIKLILNFDDHTVIYSPKRSQKEAKVEDIERDTQKLEAQREIEKENLTKQTERALQQIRSVSKGEKVINFTLEGSLLDLAQRKALAKISRYASPEAKETNTRFEKGLKKHIQESLAREQIAMLPEIFHKREDAQARRLDELQTRILRHELSEKEKKQIQEATFELQKLKEALRIVEEIARPT